ncbi:MAG TPA: M48 family metallopeptidase [Vicinamibacterales bacterium]|nr:M48 family metallopeptidase [Vicinamibacterales bacterium]
MTVLALAGGTALAAAQFRLISVEDEIALGREAQREVRKQVPEVTDREVTEYVAGIGRRLAARARGPKYPYSFSVANYREINAFALPGGPVWIHRGVIAAAANEAQLAAVLAHEIAHISERHAADQISKQLVANGLIGLLGAVLGNDRGAQTAQLGARILAGGYLLKFSRDDEREADSEGANIMRRAGWDAREMIAFMETLRREQGRDPSSVEVFLSSHPAPGERAQRLRGTLKAGGTKDSARFRQIKARVAKMPPAPSMRR